MEKKLFLIIGWASMYFIISDMITSDWSSMIFKIALKLTRT